MIFGIADVFVMVGMQELFYYQMPDTMKILGIAMYLSVLGVGNFLSSIWNVISPFIYIHHFKV